MQNPDLSFKTSASGHANASGAAPPAGALPALVDSLRIGRGVDDGWRDLRRTILGLAEGVGARRIMEIGGGRFPFFSPDEMAACGCALTVNDILESELALAPDVFEKSTFDIAGDLPENVERGVYDVVFSRMVFEHVRDARKAWSNIHSLLAPGGVGFAFVPTLWSPPFVVNAMIPEVLSASILRRIDPDRTDEKTPKFPAYYDLCRADERVVGTQLRREGFEEVVVAPFFGTPYFPVVPVLKHVARLFDRVVEAMDARMFASYAYIIARKGNV